LSGLAQLALPTALDAWTTQDGFVETLSNKFSMLTELTTRSAQLFEWFGAAQTSSMKQVGGAFKIDMAQYFELQAFSQFAADIGPETQVRLARGVRLITLLTQDAGNTLSIRQQVQTLCLSNQDSFVVMSTPQLKRLCGLLQTVPEWLSIVIPITAVFPVLMVGMCRHNCRHLA